ncbi:MAG: ribonuclease P protein component [Blastocatellia bacterium]|nr:ribonuclease P protein component [Blastocatellia bacterium]
MRKLPTDSPIDEVQEPPGDLVPPDSVGQSSSSQTFPKTDRLLLPTEFRRVYDKSQVRLHSSLFTIFGLRSKTPQTRMGITTSRKIGKAVRRNRCRRLLREVFRRHKIEIPVGWDLVINAKQPLTQATFTLVESEFLRLVKKLCRS